MSTVTESVDVEVPVHTAYNQWTQFEEFPNFMEGVEQVTQLDDRHNHWITSVSGARREFDTEIVDQLPDERVAWRTVSGDVKQKGVVTFQQLDEGHTRIRLGVPHRQPHLDPGHVLVQAWRSALALRVRGPDQGPALQRGPAARRQGTLLHDEAAARKGAGTLTGTGGEARTATVHGALSPVYGAPCWVSLSTFDKEAAQDFYAGVMGWTFGPGGLGEEFSVAYADGVPVAGMGAIARSMGVAVQWTPFFSVSDATTAASRVKERSATVAVGPIRMGGGRTALAADLAGATFGFWEGEVVSSWHAGRRSPPARLELRTRDAFAAAIFYGEVFEWASPESPCQVDYQHDAVVVRVEGRAVATLRGGAVEAAPDPDIRPHWHVSFHVDDVDEAAAASVRAGGAIAAEPDDSPFGRTAGLIDPEGGLFTVISRGG